LLPVYHQARQCARPAPIPDLSHRSACGQRQMPARRKLILQSCLLWMPLDIRCAQSGVVEEDVAPDPGDVRLFGAEGIVLEADGLADTSPSSVQAWSRSFLGLGCTGDLPLKKDLTGGRLCARIQTTKAARIRDKFLRQGHYTRKFRKM
jgi:hypothetical protein